MKVGDLVRWTNSGSESYGIVVGGPEERWGYDSPVVAVMWLDGQFHGSYSINHTYMELISESR